jgi:hypothetical protein
MGLRSLLRGSRFESGDILQVLKRVKNAKIISDAKSIGGVQKRNCVSIMLDSEKYNFNKYCEIAYNTKVKVECPFDDTVI